MTKKADPPATKSKPKRVADLEEADNSEEGAKDSVESLSLSRPVRIAEADSPAIKPIPNPRMDLEPIESGDSDDVVDDDAAHSDWVNNPDGPRPGRLVLPDGADPVVTYRDITNRPGPTRTQAEITLHTHMAHRMFYGRRKTPEKRGIVGLMRFVNNTNMICKAAQLDDPYADFRLIQIEEAMVKVEQRLDTYLAEVRDLLGGDNDRRVTVKSLGSVQPATFELSFEYTYSFRATDLLGKFDELVNSALAARHIGRLFGDDWKRNIVSATRKMRALFLLSDRFRYSGTQRDDYAANNRKAQLAIERHGELPADVLNGSRRPRLGPPIRSGKTRR